MGARSRVTEGRAGAFTEWFRVRNGQIADTQYNMVSRYEVASPDENYSYSSGYADGGERGYPYGGYRVCPAAELRAAATADLPACCEAAAAP